MTNGGGEGGSQRRELHGKRNIFRGNDFAYALARMAVAQICESVEINTYQESQNIGKTAQLYANVAGRVEGNALDIVQALEDLGSGLGFDGAPEIDHCLANSGVVKDIIRYTGEAEEIPFVYALPRFPFNRGKRPAPSFFEIGAEPPNEHIPVWLPAFPETKTSNESEDTSVDKIVEGDLQSRENGLSLTSRQQYVDVDRLKVQKSMDQKDVQKPTDEPEGNPFLAAPLWLGEKNVPRLFFPSELTNEEISINHVPEKQLSKSHCVPALKAYAPVDKINDKNRLAETEDGEKKDGARTQRALLRFKIGSRKASVCWTINQSLEEKGWFQEDGDKREKKVEREEKRESIDTDVK
ncbi:Transcription initiation factor TFIID subunit 8 [Cardamine amara subsp. amara]|uniref:Transcription initiation factor TFIID subunit 8 n=1 Tax=Cardamine amara subsp. amara TaxID=228776 RepID=A0ABD1AW96_CARAN